LEIVPETVTVPEIAVVKFAAKIVCEAASHTRPPVTPDACPVVVGIDPPPPPLGLPTQTTKPVAVAAAADVVTTAAFEIEIAPLTRAEPESETEPTTVAESV
jgi:hypothetical protein